MVSARLDPAAQNEYDAAVDWYLARSPRAAAGFATAVDEALGHVRQFPDGFPRHDVRHRYTVVDGYPYVLYYRPGDPVVVVAVAHSSLRPGYWHGRTDPPT